MRGAPPAAVVPAPGLRAGAVLAGAGMISLLSWLSIALPSPSLLTPYSLTVVLPYWFWGPVAALTLYPLLMVVTSAGLVAGRVRRPLMVACLFGLLDPLSLFFTVWGLRPGLAHYGAAHTLGILAINLMAGLGIAVLLVVTLRRPTFHRVLVLNGLFWGWIAWSALPWLRQFL